MRLVAILLAAAVALASAGVASARPSALEKTLVQDVNSERAAHGLRPLVMSPKLAGSAAEHTRDMGAQGYFEHESRDATPFWKRIEKWYPHRKQALWSVGENLFSSNGDLTARRAVTAWMASREHRVNVLDPIWREVGISAIHFDSLPASSAAGPSRS